MDFVLDSTRTWVMLATDSAGKEWRLPVVGWRSYGKEEFVLPVVYGCEGVLQDLRGFQAYVDGDQWSAYGQVELVTPEEWLRAYEDWGAESGKATPRTIDFGTGDV
jgi:hypothetical protein